LLAEALDDAWLLLIALSSLVAFRVSQHPDRLDRSAELAAREVQLARQVGNPSMISGAEFSTGYVKMAEGDVTGAIASFEASLASASRTTNELTMTTTLGYLARCYASMGDARQAVEMVHRAVMAARQTGSKVTLAQALDYGGQALITLGHDRDGACFTAAAVGGRIALRAMGGLELQRRADALAAARARLGDERYREAIAEGEALSVDTAMQRAIDVLARISPPSTAP
jgi:hypothetical protein